MTPASRPRNSQVPQFTERNHRLLRPTTLNIYSLSGVLTNQVSAVRFCNNDDDDDDMQSEVALHFFIENTPSTILSITHERPRSSDEHRSLLRSHHTNFGTFISYMPSSYLPSEHETPGPVSLSLSPLWTLPWILPIAFTGQSGIELLRSGCC